MYTLEGTFLSNLHEAMSKHVSLFVTIKSRMNYKLGRQVKIGNQVKL